MSGRVPRNSPMDKKHKENETSLSGTLLLSSTFRTIVSCTVHRRSTFRISDSLALSSYPFNLGCKFYICLVWSTDTVLSSQWKSATGLLTAVVPGSEPDHALRQLWVIQPSEVVKLCFWSSSLLRSLHIISGPYTTAWNLLMLQDSSTKQTTHRTREILETESWSK